MTFLTCANHFKLLLLTKVKEIVIQDVKQKAIFRTSKWLKQK